MTRQVEPRELAGARTMEPPEPRVEKTVAWAGPSLPRSYGPWWPRVAAAAAVIVFLLLWQFLPQVGFLSERVRFLDPFFISSPTRVWGTLKDLFGGTETRPVVWPSLLRTLQATLISVGVGVLVGGSLGLLCSNYEFLSRATRPLIVVMNAVPRIALVPVFIIVFGVSPTTAVVTGVVVVFFLVFFNAYSGGTSVPPQVLQNARILGASSLDLMLHVRMPYAGVWTFASIPNAIAFGMMAVVTAELLGGIDGMGRLLFLSLSSVDADLTFAVVVILGAVGVILVGVSDAVQRRVLHWWSGQA